VEPARSGVQDARGGIKKTQQGKKMNAVGWYICAVNGRLSHEKKKNQVRRKDPQNGKLKKV